MPKCVYGYSTYFRMKIITFVTVKKWTFTHNDEVNSYTVPLSRIQVVFPVFLKVHAVVT